MRVPPTVALVGPTASGKTALSVDLALRLGAEIVSMDSRQVYRQMDVGTAKPTAAQRAAVPHHGLDLVDPDERFSAGEFGRLARAWIPEIRARGALPLIVGGTGFFLRSLTHPIFTQPPLDPARRGALQAWLSRLDTPALHAWVAALDPEAAARLRERGGRQRLLRALELPLLSGRPLTWWHRNSPPEAPALEMAVFVLDRPRAELDRAVDARVEEMRAAGLVEEVESLLRRGYTERDPGMNATGYAELIPALRGERTLDEAFDLVRRNTRAYARRQLTWFRHQLPPGAVWLGGERSREELVDEIAASVRRLASDSPLDGRGR